MMNEKCKGYGMMVLRVFIGIMFLAHGLQKVLTPGFVGNFSVMVGNITLFSWAPTFFAWAATLSEALGGLFLIVGFLTPFAAAFNVIVMLVALFGVHLKNGFFLMNAQGQIGFEYVFVILGALIALLVEGPGKWSVDSLIKNVRTM